MAFGFRLLSVALAVGTVSTSVRAAELRSGAETRRAFSAATGRLLYDPLTTDLRTIVSGIESDLLVVAVGKAFASRPIGLDTVRRAYEAQVSAVPRNKVLVADRALHFVTLDDLAFLLAAMDEFLIEDARR